MKNFTEWLMLSSFPDPEDIVVRFRNSINADMQWPVDADSLPVFEKYIMARHPEHFEDRLFAMRTAWADYQKFRAQEKK